MKSYWFTEGRLWERTHWIDGERLERDLADVLENDWYEDSPDTQRNLAAEAILKRKGTFVALVNRDRQFLGLVDRYALLDQIRSWVSRGATMSFRSNTGAGMEQPQKVRHGEAAPRPLLRRLPERMLEGRCVGHRARRAINEKRPMPMPAPVVRGGALHGAVEALQEEVKAAQWEPGPGLAVGRRTEPYTRQVG